MVPRLPWHQVWKDSVLVWHGGNDAVLGGSSLGEGGRLHSGRGGLEHIEGNENNCCRRGIGILDSSK